MRAVEYVCLQLQIFMVRSVISMVSNGSDKKPWYLKLVYKFLLIIQLALKYWEFRWRWREGWVGLWVHLPNYLHAANKHSAGLSTQKLTWSVVITNLASSMTSSTNVIVMSEQHFRRSILHGCQSACMERAAFQSTWHRAVADYFQCPLEDILIFHSVWHHSAFVTFMISLRRI